MPTFLLTWNPKKWQWNDIQECIAQVKKENYCCEPWSTGVTKRIREDDRIFLMKLGEEPRGIVASGWAKGSVYEDKHWGDPTKTASYVKVSFDTIIDPNRGEVFSIENLRDGIYSSINWTPQASGRSISDQVAEKLERDWAKFLGNPAPVRQIAYAGEVDDAKRLHEGAVKQVTVNVYERSTQARAICIKRYGTSCSVCGFDFGETFGEIGEGFIHVHHLKPLSTIRQDYQLDPIEDLRPICPNCHAMIHSKKPEPYTIEELQAILKQNAK